MNSSIADAVTSEIEVIDQYLPTMKSGNYKVEVNQTLKISKEDTAKSFNSQQIFRVDGPQFNIQLPDIHSVFPQSNTVISGDDSLPYIVFNKRTLPWERKIKNDNSVPWVALVLLKETDVIGGEDTATRIKHIPIVDAVTNSNGGQKKIKPKLAVPDAIDISSCDVIEVNKKAFETLVPCIEEIKLLAHFRKLSNLEEKADRDMLSAGEFSMILAKSFPLASDNGTDYYAHLVSLEGFEKYLDKGKRDLTNIDSFQLISLNSWRFTAKSNNKNTFKQLLKKIQRSEHGVRMLKMPVPVPELDGEPAVVAEVNQRFQAGYVPLNHHLLTGESTFAWYRGPFIPLKSAPIAEKAFRSVSSAMRFDPESGVFDQSLSAAWQLGRSQALVDSNFSQALLNLKRNQYGALRGILNKLTSPLNNFSEDTIKSIYEKESDSTEHHKSLNEACHQALSEVQFTHNIKSDNNNVLGQALIQKVAVIDDVNESSPFSDGMQTSFPGIMGLLKSNKIKQHIEDYLQVEGKELLEQLTDWLAESRLLKNIPSYYLFPNKKMVKEESINFFYLDEAWLKAFVDGALSIVLYTELDVVMQNAVTKKLYQKIRRRSCELRQKRLPEKAAGKCQVASINKVEITGVVIKSKLVSGWPGLEIVARDKHSKIIQIIKFDQIDDEQILCLFAGQPESIEFKEPLEGLFFGCHIVSHTGKRTIKINDQVIPVDVDTTGTIKLTDLLSKIKAASSGAIRDFNSSLLANSLQRKPVKFILTCSGDNL